MTILFVRRGYSPTGGAERYMRRLAGELQNRGLEIILLANDNWPADAWPGNIIERIHSNLPTKFAEQVATIQKKYRDSITFSMEQIPTADIYRTAAGLHSCWLERVAKESNPIASFFRRLRPTQRQRLQNEHNLFSNNSHFHTIAISNMVADEILSKYPNLKPRLHTIHVGYTPPEFSPNQKAQTRNEIRTQLGIPQDAPVILFVGSGWKRKGASILANAFKSLNHPTAHLLIVGKGTLGSSTPPNTHLTGPVKDATPYYLAADLFCLPSLYDPFANACLEAASLGLPVITYQSVGFSDALGLHPGAGESLPLPRDPEILAKTLEKWLTPTQLLNAQPALQALATDFTLQNNVHQTLKVIQEIAHFKSQTPPAKSAN